MKAVDLLGRSGPAPWLGKERKRITQLAVGDANRVRKALSECGIQLSGKTERIPTEIADMLEVFRHFRLSVDCLVSGKKRRTRALGKALLQQIRNDLYFNMPYHLSGFRKPLDLLIDQLSDARTHTDLLAEELERTHRPGRPTDRGRAARGSRRAEQIRRALKEIDGLLQVARQHMAKLHTATSGAPRARQGRK